MTKKIFLAALGLTMMACSNNDVDLKHPYQNICGRDIGDTTQREFIYRARIPPSWSKQDPTSQASISDTKTPICEFYITQDRQEIRITIHNFPAAEIESRIPPSAQIARWKNQFEHLLPESVILIPQSFNGYTGLLFEGSGTIDSKNMAVMAWALQMGQQHIRALKNRGQLSADVTIKAVGDPTLMQKMREEIAFFARSFELIEEIPSAQ